MFFTNQTLPIVHSIGCPLGFQFGSLQQKCDPDRRAQNSHKRLLCFCPSGIPNFHSFGRPLVSQFESLLQKCAPDKRAQNSHKSRLGFFANPAFSIFNPLVVPWGRHLDPCSESVILTGARENHIKIVYVFCPSDISRFHSFGCPLGFQLRSLQQKCDPKWFAQNSHKSRLCFLPIIHFHFQSFGFPLGSQFGSISISSCLPIIHFHFQSFGFPLGPLYSC